LPNWPKKNSQDPGSAANGGDLGLFGRGMMVKSFDEAVFALKPGEISDLVKSDFGYHIIKLTAIKPAQVVPFNEVSAGILSKLREQKAADSFAELADKFSNTVYEQSDTLHACRNACRRQSRAKCMVDQRTGNGRYLDGKNVAGRVQR